MRRILASTTPSAYAPPNNGTGVHSTTRSSPLGHSMITLNATSHIHGLRSAPSASHTISYYSRPSQRRARDIARRTLDPTCDRDFAANVTQTPMHIETICMWGPAKYRGCGSSISGVCVHANHTYTFTYTLQQSSGLPDNQSVTKRCHKWMKEHVYLYDLLNCGGPALPSLSHTWPRSWVPARWRIPPHGGSSYLNHLRRATNRLCIQATDQYACQRPHPWSS